MQRSVQEDSPNQRFGHWPHRFDLAVDDPFVLSLLFFLPVPFEFCTFAPPVDGSIQTIDKIEVIEIGVNLLGNDFQITLELASIKIEFMP